MKSLSMMLRPGRKTIGIGMLLVGTLIGALLGGCAAGDRPEGAAAFPVDGLVTTEQLADRIAAGGPLVIIDTRHPSDYAAGHLPSAISVPLEKLGPQIRTRIDARIRKRLTEKLVDIGARDGLPLVAVDEGSREGFIRAANACWLIALGAIESCHVVEGGISTWMAEGRELATEASQAAESGSAVVTERPLSYADLKLMRKLVFESSTALVDMQDDPAATTVPGSWPAPLARLVDESGRVDREQLAETVKLSGLTAERNRVVFGYEQSDGAAGWFLLSRVAGLGGVRLYAGGMREWITYPHLPQVRSASTSPGAASETMEADPHSP